MEHVCLFFSLFLVCSPVCSFFLWNANTMYWHEVWDSYTFHVMIYNCNGSPSQLSYVASIMSHCLGYSNSGWILRMMLWYIFLLWEISCAVSSRYLWHDWKTNAGLVCYRMRMPRLREPFKHFWPMWATLHALQMRKNFAKYGWQMPHFRCSTSYPPFFIISISLQFSSGAEDWKTRVLLTSAGKGWEPERRSWISSALRISEGREWFSCYTSGESGSNVAQYCRLWAQLRHSQSFLWSVVERLQFRPWLESWVFHKCWTL